MSTEQQVRERAYFIWEIEGRRAGHADAHWLQAEAELRANSNPLAIDVLASAVAPNATKAPKSTAKKVAKTAKTAERQPAKPKRSQRAGAEQAALH